MSYKNEGDLKKTITLGKGISLTIGSVIGSGLLALPGIAYVKYGTSSLVSWLTTALLIFPFIFIFSDLSSRYPSAGGIYEFSKLFGDRISQILAFIIAGTWPVGIPILSIIGSNYIARIFTLPESLTPLIAFLMLLIVSFLNFFGAEVSGNVQKVVVVLTASLLLCVVIAAIPEVGSIKYEMDPVAVWKSMSLVFWAYLGFENVTFLSGEFKNPARDFFLSLSVGLLFVVSLYLGLSYAVVGLLDRNRSAELTPVVDVIHKVGGDLAALIAAIVSVLIVFINLNAWVWGASRSIYSASRDATLPKFLSKINRHGSPFMAIFTLLFIWTIVLVLYSVCNLTLASMFMVANQNFVIMYLISIAAYVKLNNGMKRTLGIVTIAVVVVFMMAYGYAIIYPTLLAMIALAYRRLGRLIRRKCVHFL